MNKSKPIIGSKLPVGKDGLPNLVPAIRKFVRSMDKLSKSAEA